MSASQKRENCLLRNVPESKNVDLAKQFGISPGQVTNILKKSAKWLAIDQNSYKANLKRKRSSKIIKTEEALIMWIEKALECNLTVTGSIIQQKVSKRRPVGFKNLSRGILLVPLINTTNRRVHQSNRFQK